MFFPWILLVLVGGDVLPWAGFQTREACEQVREHLSAPKNATLHCAKGDKA